MKIARSTENLYQLLTAMLAVFLFLSCAGGRHTGEFKSAGIEGESECGIECPPKTDLPLDLDVLCKRSGRNVATLTALLQKDGITVHGVEEHSASLPAVRIELSRQKFKDVFEGIVAYTKQALSASPGYYCQVFIQHYKIPKKYSGLIKQVRIIDPQKG